MSQEKEGDTNKSPEETATFLSKVTYGWFYRVLIKGWRHTLQFENVYDLEEKNKSKPLSEEFHKFWKPTAEEMSSAIVSDLLTKGPYVTKAILQTIGSAIIMATAFKIVSLGLTFAGPFLMRLLLQYVDSGETSTWKGYILALSLFLSVQLNAFCTQRELYHSSNFGMRMRTIVTSAVYYKALKLTKATRRHTTVGEIVNLMSVDAQKLQEVPTYVSSLWSTLVTSIVCVGVLWQTVGIAVLSAILLLLILILFNGFYIGNQIHLSQAKQMSAKDLRVKTFSEVLVGIKLIKLYAWEKVFHHKVSSHRDVELKSVRWINTLNSFSAVMWNMSSYVACLVIFTTYVFISEENVLNADTIFFTVAIVNVMKYPLSMLSLAIGRFAEARVSMRRVKRFLLLEEFQEDAVIQDSSMEQAIRITDGTFSWGKELQPFLNDISMSVSKGELVAVVGEVGSGKSSLISALLGEIIRCRGCVKVSGSIAYVPQEAWILSKTVRDNILLGKPKSPIRYNRVLDKCTLTPDLKKLSHGDKTEIGEKGINLSDGQKQRVSLARAVYQDKDIYLLDDPLSAVDADVGKKLFENVIGPKGMLKDKTRILVTHNVTYLPQVDKIMVMQDGRISESGTYHELLLKDGNFADFLSTYLEEEEIEIGEETKDLEQLIKTLPPTFVEGALARQKSIQEEKLFDASQERALMNRANNLKRRQSRQIEIAKDKFIERQLSVPTDQLVCREKERHGNISLDVIWSYIKSCGGLWVSIILVFHLLSVVGFVLGSIWLSSWANDADMAVNGTQPNNTYFRLGVYAGYVGIQVLTMQLGSLGIGLGCYQASRLLHSTMLHRIIRSPMMFFDTTPLGRIMNRCSKDMDQVDVNTPFLVRSWFYTVLQLLGTLTIIIYSTPIFLAAGIPIIVVYLILQRLYMKSARQLQRINSVKSSPVFVHFDESIVGITSIRAYKRTDAFIEKCHLLVDDSQKAWYMVLISMRWLGLTMTTLANLVTFFAALFVVIQKDSIGSGLAGLSISYSLRISTYMFIFVRGMSSLETCMVAAERIKEYTEISSEADWEIPENKPTENWPQSGKVTFDKFSTTYRPTLKEVLKNISFTAESSEKIGVVGRTGAGKSSIALSLFRIIEATEGSISIDGLDISKIGLHDLRARLTIIPQDPVIFCGTLRNNLDPEEKSQDSEIWNSLDLAHLKDFVQNLIGELDYDCGEGGGEALSMGQRQLLCLARALLRKSKVLIMDEATSATDLATDELIQETIRQAFSDCTVITIAHRLNSIIDYDRILVLDNGSVAEFDAPDILLQKENSIFYSMAKSAKLC